MRVFISGKISGLSRDEAVKRFSDAETLLQQMDFDTVNPINSGLDSESTWFNHMNESIRLLGGCDAIFMLSNWRESRGAKIEHNFAVGAGLAVMFEDIEIDKAESEKLERIEKLTIAIQEVTGLSYEAITTDRKNKTLFFARMIFAYHCKHMRYVEVGKLLNRTRTTINYYINRYDEEFKYNKPFKDMAKSVEKIMNK